MSQSAKRFTKQEEAAMRAAGLRPVTLWVPDTSRPDFAKDFERQVKAVAEAEKLDPTIEAFSDAALAELDLPPYEER